MSLQVGVRSLILLPLFGYFCVYDHFYAYDHDFIRSVILISMTAITIEHVGEYYLGFILCITHCYSHY